MAILVRPLLKKNWTRKGVTCNQYHPRS
jgi:hypothetical protein